VVVTEAVVVTVVKRKYILTVDVAHFRVPRIRSATS
jgi:hypothetical protein